MKKLKAGLISFTSCFGCSFEFLNLRDDLLRVFQNIDFVDFKLIKEKNVEKDYDLVFVEGAISGKDEIKKIIDVRNRSKFVVALGACACNGCVLTIKNYEKDAEKRVYGSNKYKSTDVKGIDAYIKVDYYLRGCPFFKHELLEFLKSWLNGNIPREKDYSVCVECRKRENDCLLDKGILCLGPISRAGCKAICPTNDYQCVGCRGLSDDNNLEKFLELAMQKLKVDKKTLKEKLKMYNLFEEIKNTDSWKKLGSKRR
ncbi:MAG: NADH:ubiquinone oxidoreductase [Candidatus Heimdallarchaeota archaeon]